MNGFARVVLLVGSIVITSGCAVHVQANDHRPNKNYDSVFGGIDIDKNSSVGNLSSVNGGIDIASDATVRSVETVNGGIELSNNVTLKSAETVNGGIEAGEGLSVEQNMETVNGGIQIGASSNIGGSLYTVNGDINLSGVIVGKNIKTVNGDMFLKNGTQIIGDLIVESSGGTIFGWGNESPTIEIDETSSVGGTVHLYKPAVLKISDDAKVGAIERHYKQK